jgi:hypothetical protein
MSIRALSVYFGVSSLCTRAAEGPGDYGSGIFMAEEFDGVGAEGLGDTTELHVETLLKPFLEDVHS